MTIPTLQPGLQALPNLYVLRARGAEASSFLHNMLTQDLLLMPAGTGRLASLCSAKGRIMASGWVLKVAAEEILWVLHASLGAVMLKRLNMFKLRMKVQLDDASAELASCGVLTAGSSAVARGAVAANAGGFTFGLGHAAGCDLDLQLGGAQGADTTGDWHLAQILTGIGQVTSATAEAFVPQMLNHESVGGVNFKKGCYPGQEVVARSQFRGAIKRRGYIVSSAGPMLPGDAITQAADPQDEVGKVCNSVPHGDRFYAIASLHTAAADHSLAHQGNPVQVLELPYPLLLDI